MTAANPVLTMPVDSETPTDGADTLSPLPQPRPLPYSRQWVGPDDVEAVTQALQSDRLTTGPLVEQFETDFTKFTQTGHAVAVSNGTAALHAALHAAEVQPGDEVIVPAISFVATANCAVYARAMPVFADVDPETMLIDPESVSALITSRTRAVIGVDYAGQPCDYDQLRALTEPRGIALIADACHSLGARLRSKPSGSLADLSAFSFHAVKPITTGEGGMVTTDDSAMAKRVRRFRNHGIDLDYRERERFGTWEYDMTELGHNYRLTDLQCALGRTQLAKLPDWLTRREQIAARYSTALASRPDARPLKHHCFNRHAWHLFVIRLQADRMRDVRKHVFTEMRRSGIGVNVHYRPIHLHSFYREHLGTRPGLCPAAERAYEEILSLPLFPEMSDADVDRVLDTLLTALDA